jgi:hypothetical protein
MPEPITPPVDLAAELETLRTVNAELLKKIHDRTAKATELESSITQLQGKLSEADAAVREMTISAPLRQLSESISLSPVLFQEQFNKQYTLEHRKGVLTLLKDGKLVLDKNGKDVPFTREALIPLLTSGDDPQSNIFKQILITSRASGASGVSGNQGGSRTSKSDAPNKPSFGLR